MQNIYRALAKAQGQFENVVRDLVASVQSQKGDYAYSYADLGACLRVIRKPLADNGLAVIQPTRIHNGDVVVQTVLTHETGETIDYGELRMTPQRPGPQAIGSCITYARRYALAAALGLAQTDDDANGAEAHAEHAAPTKSMQAAIKMIDQCQSYDAFKAAWQSLDRAVREEIAKRKPKQIDIWKERFRADHDQGEGGDAKPHEDGAEAVGAGSGDTQGD